MRITLPSTTCPECLREAGHARGCPNNDGFSPAPSPEPRTYGMCTACGSVEVALVSVTGRRDLSGMGESSQYPVGYGCEVCS